MCMNNREPFLCLMRCYGNTEEMPTTNNGPEIFEKTSPENSVKELSFVGRADNKKHNRRRHRLRSSPNRMQATTTAQVQVHRSPPAKVHGTTRRNRSQSRHERHKCHKHRQRLEEEQIMSEVSKLRNENYVLSKRLNVSMSSLDSGLATSEPLPPFEVDLKNAYQHVKNENTQLLEEVKFCRSEHNKMKEITQRELQESANLRQDIAMLQNLVYRLNVELEKYQDLREKARNLEGGAKKTNYELPKYYQKNFLKPILPLLKAYSEVTQEKNEIIEHLEDNLEKFNASFNELLKENETLYKELEVKLSDGDENMYDEVKTLKREAEILKEEKDLYWRQSKLEAEKLKEVHAVYKSRVNTMEKEKLELSEKVHEVKAELYTLRGKHSVTNKELDRLRVEDESKIPLVVHSASIAECKRLFQDLKNEHDSDKQSLRHNLKELETKLRMKDEELRRNEEERLTLEQGNFDLVFENDSLKRRIAELEASTGVGGSTPATGGGENEATTRAEAQELKKLLREAKKRNSELESKLQKTKKQLQQSMAFAEGIVREQEGLLSQLHEKQRENSMMATQFGSLKHKLKSVEKGAIEGLNSVEDKMKAQEAEKLELQSEVQRLTDLLRERNKFESEGFSS